MVCLLAVQPALGQLHHQNFVKTGSRGIFSYVHLWWGRIFLVLGVINGGLGFQLSHSKESYIVAYSIVSVACYLIYLVVKVMATVRHQKRAGNAGKMSPRTGYSVEHGDDEVPMTSHVQHSIHQGK